jgi:hypothetical protein
MDRYPDQKIFRSFLRVFEEDIEVPIVFEDPCVKKLIFEVIAREPPVRFHQIPIWVLSLRILVEILHVGMRGCGI